ncbi:hypothetical protein ABT127_16910 [Streptomyces sp. NPDC001904]|uniref:hypothetical protein n=1 Tax=Streptomyces sp. NPDC001904 TaxID=3154531 RepID=UPI00332284B4
MTFFGAGGDGEALDRFLSKGRMLCLAAVPVCWVLCVFFIAEEGWRFGFLAGFLLPPVAAYLGLVGHREVRPGMTALACALVLATVPLALVFAWLEGH